MAIGNAPWPIGVTMVGIHARTGREKIFARNVAHVLNDETQRKYIQVIFGDSVFRFLTSMKDNFTIANNNVASYNVSIFTNTTCVSFTQSYCACDSNVANNWYHCLL